MMFTYLLRAAVLTFAACAVIDVGLRQTVDTSSQVTVPDGRSGKIVRVLHFGLVEVNVPATMEEGPEWLRDETKRAEFGIPRAWVTVFRWNLVYNSEATCES